MKNKIDEIKKLIEKHDSIAVFHHLMPDGDSLSSSYALLRAIQKTYPNKKVVWPANVDYLKKRFSYLDIDFEKNNVSTIDESYLTILGDCQDPARTYKGAEFLKGKIKIMFDHHRTDPAVETDVWWHEPTWSASAMQSYLIAKSFVKEWDEELALLFYFGIMTDTGRFAYSLADPLPLQLSAELLEHISDDKLSKVYEEMNKRELKDIKFEGWVLNNFKEKDGVAWLKVTKEEQEKMNLTPDDCVRVNLISNISGIKIWLFFVQYSDFIRVELRSLGAPVNEIAKQFNGGGHIKAAGCKINKMEEAVKIIEASIKAL